MKKFITCGIAAALCTAALSAQVFAADITEDRSIYADNAEQIASSGKDLTFDERSVKIDPDTVIPYYYANLSDLATKGKLEFTTKNNSGEREYIADVVDSTGEFAGVVKFSGFDTNALSVQIYGSKHSETPGIPDRTPVDFSANSKNVKSLLTFNNIGTDVKEVKLVFVNGLGHVYYINTGSEEVLVPANTVKGDVMSKYFYDDGKELLVINDELKAKVAAEAEKTNKPSDTTGSSTADKTTNVGGGGNSPALDEDTKIPNTGNSTAEVVGAAVLMSAAARAAAIITKKHKNC